MKSERVQKQAALLRARNTEISRRRLWREIQKQLTAGKISEREAASLKRDFWEARYVDTKKAAGKLLDGRL